MRTIFLSLTLLTLMLSSQSMRAEDMSADAFKDAYLKGKTNIGIILLHRRGQHARFHVVNPLRIFLNETRDWHTLSMQMPDDDLQFTEYGKLFPKAYRRIHDGIDYLRHEAGVDVIFIIGHGMGGRMASAFLAKYPEAGIDGFVAVGLRNGGNYPLNPMDHLQEIKIPILDVYSDATQRDTNDAAMRKKFESRRYEQIKFKGADYDFSQRDQLGEMLFFVRIWLDKQIERILGTEDQAPVTPSI